MLETLPALEWRTERRKIDDLIPFEGNPRQLTTKQAEDLKKSLKRFNLVEIPAITLKNKILAGHQRLTIMKTLGRGQEEIDVRVPSRDLTEEEEKEYLLRSNKNTGEWDWDALANFDHDVLLDVGFTADELDDGFGLGLKDKGGAASGRLAERFLVPPFSVLDARQGYWMDRKRAWRALIGDMGESREGLLGFSNLTTINSGVSILDPVLAEIACRWFCPDGGLAFDPFAGDTVFGFVASRLGHPFFGTELRKEQAELNQKRCDEANLPARYACDDGQNIAAHLAPESQDLLFSCPPYFDLEHYSDLPNDASNQASYKDFLAIMDKAFSGSIACLKSNRFAFIVVGDVRDKRGVYLGLPSDIKDIFSRYGMALYNELVLVDPVGTAPLRAARVFKKRKVVKTHQNVLVFYKGDIERIKEEFPELEIPQDLIEKEFEAVEAGGGGWRWTARVSTSSATSGCPRCLAMSLASASEQSS